MDILERIRQDLIDLAKDHEGTASNEHTWALGSDGELAEQHELHAEEHRKLAVLYRNMAEEALTILEQFGGM